MISLLSCTGARATHPQTRRSRYFGVSMTSRNHTDDFSQNKWSLSSIILPKFVSKTKINVRQESNINVMSKCQCHLCTYNSMYLQNALSIPYFTHCSVFLRKCAAARKPKKNILWEFIHPNRNFKFYT